MTASPALQLDVPPHASGPPASERAHRPLPAWGGTPQRPAISIRVLVPSLAVALLAFAVLGAAMISERNSRGILMREIETRLMLEARSLASAGSGALLTEFPELTLHPLVRDMLAERPEITFAAVVDHRGVIQGHADARALGTRYQPPPDLVAATATIALKRGESLRENASLLVAIAPIAPPSGGVLGSAVVGMKRAYLESAIADSRRQQTWLLLGLLVIGVTATFVLMTVLLKPIGILRLGLERIGRGDLDTPLVTRDRTELGLLAHTVNRMAAELKVAQRDIVEKERLAREVELARSIQQSLLPHGRLDAGCFVLEGSHRAAAEVGGDYYDILPLDGGRIAIAIADVSGKGLGGCLVMSMLSALLRALRDAYPSPSQLLVSLESNLTQTLPRGSFVTMFYGVLEPVAGRITFASAGHTPVLVYRAAPRTIEWRYGRAIPIGAVRGGALRRMLKDETIELQAGDLLVHFTDGYNEAMRNGDGEQFGLQRMADVVSRTAASGSSAVIQALEDAVREWAGTGPPLDDETLLVVARNETSSKTPARVAETPARAAETPAPVAAASSIRSLRELWASVPGMTASEALALLDRGRRHGHRLTLGADFEQLLGIRAWIQGCPDLVDLDPRAVRMLESALYEVCANVVEHGYRGEHERTFDLWWVPGEPGSSDPGPVRRTAAEERMRNGCFVLQDQGAQFKAPHRPLLDFHDPQVRRRGRGIGLDMIRRIMKSIDYHPGTAEGNLTIMVFDPARAAQTPGGIE